MLRALSGRDVPDYLSSLIFKDTEGNPFFIEELYRHLVEQGKLFEIHRGEFRLDLKPKEIDVPRSVRLVIGRRLARLSDEVAEILSIAGIIGRTFTFRILEASTGMDPEELLDRVEEAERTGLITSTVEYPEAKFHFSHELVRRATVDSLSSVRRQRIHLSAADAIEKLYSDTLEDHAEELAHHLWNAGSSAELSKTTRFITIAAQHALEQSAYEVALAHVQNAVALFTELPETPERGQRELEVQLVRGVALMATLGWAMAATGDAYARARELSLSLGDTSKLFSVLYGLSVFHLTRGEHPRAFAVAQEMRDLAISLRDDGLQVQAYWTLGTATYFMGRFSESHDYIQRAISLYDPSRHRDLAAHFAQDPYMSSLVYDAATLWMLGYSDQAETSAQAALDFARQLGHPFTLCWCIQGADLFLYVPPRSSKRE